MPEHVDDATIVAALLALATDLAMPDVDQFTARVLAQLPGQASADGTRRGPSRRPRSRRKRWSIAVAAIVAAITATTLAIPDARATVADWLGIDGVRIVRVDHLPATDTTTTTPSPARPADAQLLSTLGLAPESSLDSAATRLAIPLRRPTIAGLAPADLIGSGASDRPVQLAQVWRASASLQPSNALADVAIVLTQLRVGLSNGGFQKALPRGAILEQVTVSGQPAWWITGDLHELTFFSTDGRLITDSLRLAGDTLLWSADGITYRLESSLGKDRAIAFANSVN
jgi:hypothetical protein